MMVDQANKLRDMFSAKEVIQPKEISSRVITISSGKGGVGKTNFAVNLAIELCKHNKRVVLIDADLGLANVEVLFGIIPRYSLADMLNGTRTVDEILTDGPMGIKFISGGSGLKELVNVTDKHLNRILENFQYLDSISDVIIIDTGAGVSNVVTNFIRASSETIIVTTPEPTSITDAYALIKAIKTGEVEGESLPEFKLIVNRVDTTREGEEIFQKLSKVSEKFLGVKLECLGFIPMDPLLIKAVKRQQPVSVCYPNAEFTESIRAITLSLLNIKSAAGTDAKVGIKSFIKRLVKVFDN